MYEINFQCISNKTQLSIISAYAVCAIDSQQWNQSRNSIILSTCFQRGGGLCNTLMKGIQTFIFEDIFNQSL